MEPTYNKILLAFILSGCISVVHLSKAVTLKSSPAGICQDRSKNCNGSFVTGNCPGDQGFCAEIPHLQSTKECDTEGLHIITRDSWGARTPLKHIGSLPSTLDFLIIHHAYGYTCAEQLKCMHQMRAVQTLHQTERGFADIGYHYLIGGDGTVFEGLGRQKIGSHAPGHNTKSIGVCLLGNFTTTLPSDHAFLSLQKLYTCLKRIGTLSEEDIVFGHRDVRPTDCPGTKFYEELEKNKLGFSWHRKVPDMWINCGSSSGYCKQPKP